MKVGSISFHSIPFCSVSFRSTKEKLHADENYENYVYELAEWNSLEKKKKNITAFEKRCEYFESKFNTKLNKIINTSIFLSRKRNSMDKTEIIISIISIHNFYSTRGEWKKREWKKRNEKRWEVSTHEIEELVVISVPVEAS